MGALDADSQWVADTMSQHGVDETGARHRNKAGAVVQLLNEWAGTVESEAEGSLIADGVRLNWTNGPGAAYLVTVLLIKGMDEAKVGTYTATSPDGNKTNVDVGFVPDVFISMVSSSSSSFDDVQAWPSMVSLGLSIRKEPIVNLVTAIVDRTNELTSQTRATTSRVLKNPVGG